jgi:putative ABC transport system permease protein
MNSLSIAMRGIRERRVSSAITIAAVALACSLLMLVWAFKKEAEQSFAGASGGFDAVLGPRGSKLQIVLNALYHLDESPGLMRWSDYEQATKFPAVEAAYPLAVGDNYRGYRLVGSIPEYLQNHEYAEGRLFELESGGSLFASGSMHAVVGAFAARRLGLGVGDTFHPYHGLVYNEGAKHEEIYTVTGILKATGTPVDKVVWIPISGIQTMSGHNPKAATDVSAVLIKLKRGASMAGFQLDMMYNKQGDRLTLAWPANRTILQFFDKISWFDKILQAVAALVAIIAGGSILAILYNAMNERKRDIAVLRALGARKRTVFMISLLEAVGMTFAGVILGFVVYAGLGMGIGEIVQSETGVALSPFTGNAAMLWAPLGMFGIGLLSGVLPAIKAYRTDVSRNLR